MSPCISLSAPAYKTPVWCSFQPTPQHAHMHACKHAWNDSVAATVREADADAGSSGRLLCSTQEIAFSTSNARTSLYPIPETPIPLNPPSPLPSKPQNSSRTRGQAQLYCPNTDFDSECTTLAMRRSVQLHNGPLRSCRKIRGKTAVQQSPSRRACRRPSPKMHNMADRKKRRVNAEQPKPKAPSHHHDSTPPRQHPPSALVWSQSIWSMVGSGCKPRRRCYETGFTF